MLTTIQAKNQTLNIGGFPLRSVEQVTLESWQAKNPSQSTAMITIASRIQDGKATLMLGAPGVGKTYLASAIAFTWYKREYFRDRGKAKYHTLAGIMSDQKSSWSQKGSVAPIEVAKQCGLLVLDEITPQNDSVYDQRELRELIDARYRDKKPTILISNLTAEHLPTMFDGAILDRLLEGDKGIITLTGESHRQ